MKKNNLGNLSWFLLVPLVSSFFYSCITESKTKEKHYPTVKLTANKSEISKGDSLSITIYAEDDVGLASAWWVVENDRKDSLLLNTFYNCDSAKVCERTWSGKIEIEKDFWIIANSRDVEYPVPGEPGWIQAKCPLVDSIYIFTSLPSSMSCA